MGIYVASFPLRDVPLKQLCVGCPRTIAVASVSWADLANANGTCANNTLLFNNFAQKYCTKPNGQFVQPADMINARGLMVSACVFLAVAYVLSFGDIYCGGPRMSFLNALFTLLAWLMLVSAFGLYQNSGTATAVQAAQGGWVPVWTNDPLISGSASKYVLSVVPVYAQFSASFWCTIAAFCLTVVCFVYYLLSGITLLVCEKVCSGACCQPAESDDAGAAAAAPKEPAGVEAPTLAGAGAAPAAAAGTGAPTTTLQTV